MEKRKFIDCRESSSDTNCTIRISGSEEEVLELAVHHAITVHSHENTPELKERIKEMLKDEKQVL